MKVDEEYASKLSRNDYYRLARAIDIVERTGKRMKDFVKKDHWGDNYDFRGIVLFRDKIDLYQRIDKRCEEMIELGLMEETASLLKNNLIDKNFRVIGYHEAIEFLLNVKVSILAHGKIYIRPRLEKMNFYHFYSNSKQHPEIMRNDNILGFVGKKI